ncbi:MULTISPECIES: hypothetical protein [Rhodococcus]|uniref:hypothetical protein n=1 Tax=Rhodococcus TaxID=1827 RepID=UPI000AA4D4E0|nr:MULTISPECIES: hypothetical protein [Rhodococcus]MCJ0949215.1 hypothetical protein [Rhodococcus sp. ARC_M8]MDF3317882.1 hypothetical protein [Rhodococcus sp. C3V]UDF21594.1 hypothetical protein LE551_01545 [Rhodococcus qingshengii]ULD43942.1 hypothetical protein JKI97_13240 [Rhodococcus qingshengii]UXF67728.1 hypothetical protein N6G92_01405 [Rhodococcus qingshengii]
MSASSLRRDPASGLTLKVMARKGPPEAESVTAVLAARSQQFLRELDPVFDVDMYRSVRNGLPDGVTVEQALASNGGRILTLQAENSLEAAMIESRKSPDAAGGIYPLSFGHQLRLFIDNGNIEILIGFGGTAGAGSLLCTFIWPYPGGFADESLISLSLKLVQGMADIWDAHTAVLYRDAELTPQYNVPGDATVGSCTYFGPEMPINETQIPPTVEAFPYKKGTIVIQRDPRAPLVADDIRSIRAAVGLPAERPEVRLPKGSRRL